MVLLDIVVVHKDSTVGKKTGAVIVISVGQVHPVITNAS